MAKKKRAKRAPKSQGITINWGIVGLIVVIALLIGMWQMADKSEAQSGTWPALITRASATVRLNGDVDVSWRQLAVSPEYVISGYRIETLASGAQKSMVFDLNPNQINTTELSGQKGTLYYATVKDQAMTKAIYGDVWVMPIFTHAIYAPNSVNVLKSGQKVRAMLTY
ncbi:hypothetical protein JXA59_03250 [Patescibacteria group bacterium]|nr:hypothetical protein [Patescibacteria group bacterium]